MRRESVDQVLDYVAMGMPNRKPRRLHLTDCPHPSVTALYRQAEPEELRTLPECYHCARSADA